jgi:hypothetical protein
MALQKNFESAHGIELNSAYHRVENVMLIDKTKMSFNVRAYVNNEAKFLPLKDSGHTCNYEINGLNPIKQAYEYLKTLPEFAGATDC